MVAALSSGPPQTFLFVSDITSLITAEHELKYILSCTVYKVLMLNVWTIDTDILDLRDQKVNHKRCYI